MEEVNVYVLTYNCARELVKPDVFAQHLFDALPSSQPPDVLVISLQEIAPIAYSFLGGSYLVSYYNRIGYAVDVAASNIGSQSYVNIIRRSVGMTAITAFVLKSKLQNIGSIHTAGVGVGLAGMGNKGAVALRLSYAVEAEELELSFIAAHLAPMEWALARRNEDWKKICQGLVFTPIKNVRFQSSSAERRPQASNEDDNAPLLRRQTNHSAVPSSGLFSRRSHIILAGDLNYRTSKVKPSIKDFNAFPQPCENQDNPRHFSHLLKEDQLIRELKAQRTCHGLQESPIDFPPTYKYSDRQRAVAAKDDGVMWDWAKHRWPSWCDRILYSDLPFWMKTVHPSASLKIHGYVALPLMSTSDHRPVALSMSLPAIAIPSLSTDASGEDVRLAPPFDIDPDWRAKRAAARRRELIVGVMAFLSLTMEGRIIVLALVIGAFGGWWIVRGLLDR